MSIIQRMLKSVFETPEYRVLLLGLDSSGRTTLLYKEKLGELITTIPTIGFNVETLQVDGTKLTVWDVGGCDKIRPLWRHYFHGTDAIVYFVDSSDRDRRQEQREEYNLILQQEELRDSIKFVLANKQDLPHARSGPEVATDLQVLDGNADPLFHGAWPVCALTSEGVPEFLFALVAALRARGPRPPAPPTSGDDGSGGGGGGAGMPSPGGEEGWTASREEALLAEWLEREDEPDDAFLAKLEACELESWDHRTHLRIAWLYLTKHGRREGMKLIFRNIKRFILHSSRTKRSRGTTFHETMTYFWVHMVHYSIETTTNPTGTFKGFLLMAPQLSNGGMFLAFYTKKHMLNNPEAREKVVLPDKKPLPSFITDVGSLKERGSRDNGFAQTEAKPKHYEAVMDPHGFLSKFEENKLDRWSHETFLQVLALYLLRDGRRNGTEQILVEMERLEGRGEWGFHLTLNYFWIQMVTYGLELSGHHVARVNESKAQQIVSEEEKMEQPSSPFKVEVKMAHVMASSEEASAVLQVKRHSDSDDKKEQDGSGQESSRLLEAGGTQALDSVCLPLAQEHEETQPGPTIATTPSHHQPDDSLGLKLQGFLDSAFYQGTLIDRFAWRAHYSQHLLFGKDEHGLEHGSRTTVMLPDLKPLPSVVPPQQPKGGKRGLVTMLKDMFSS